MSRLPLQAVLLEFYRRELARLGRAETARRLGVSLIMVDHLRRGQPKRAVGFRHIDRLIEAEGKSLTDGLKELAVLASAMEVVHAIDENKPASATPDPKAP